jgi:DNA-directed RNA polymerase subunit RPC12/RpoP
MNYFVPIDRATVRSNPTAGNTVSHIMGPVVLRRHRRYRVLAVFREEHSTKPASPASLNDWLTHTIKESNERMNPETFDRISTERNDVCISHNPEPRWLYSYVATPVKCEACGAEFSHMELESDADFDDAHSETVCPKCGDWAACELTFEKIEDVVREMKLEPEPHGQ